MPCLFPLDAYVYSELPASVRSERGLPGESDLVLCSSECASGGKDPTPTQSFVRCLPGFLMVLLTYHPSIYPCAYAHTYIHAYTKGLGYKAGAQQVNKMQFPHGAHSRVKEKGDRNDRAMVRSVL